MRVSVTVAVEAPSVIHAMIYCLPDDEHACQMQRMVIPYHLRQMRSCSTACWPRLACIWQTLRVMSLSSTWMQTPCRSGLYSAHLSASVCCLDVFLAMLQSLVALVCFCSGKVTVLVHLWQSSSESGDMWHAGCFAGQASAGPQRAGGIPHRLAHVLGGSHQGHTSLPSSHCLCHSTVYAQRMVTEPCRVCGKQAMHACGVVSVACLGTQYMLCN